MKSTYHFVGGVSVLFLAALAGCGDGKESRFGEGDGSGGGTTGTGGGGVSSISDAGTDGSGLISGIEGGTGGVVILQDGQVCAGEDFDVAPVPFDMFIMLDQSLSMADHVGSGTRWSAVTSAIQSFLSQSDVSFLGVGLQYFPLPQPGGGVIVPDSCDATQYAAPAVEIGPLSDPAVVKALTDSINAHGPVGFTPTAPALQGALDHAKGWAMAHPDRPTIVVLATDGEPTECMPGDGSQIADTIVAPARAGDPSIRTFVIGIGSAVYNLDVIADRGGTGRATLVADSANTAEQVKTALLRISHTALACNYVLPVPDGGPIEPDFVNVLFTPTGGAPQLLPLLAGNGFCTAKGGWFYDNPKTPTKIYICPETCGSLASGKLAIKVGCPMGGMPAR